MTTEFIPDRSREWFVPSVGPLKLRLFIGLLFWPYTAMVLGYTLIGSAMADRILWDRAGAILVIYLFGLGFGAHALDAIGSKGPKPWGNIFTRRQLWTLAVVSIAAAYAIGLYYIVRHTPLLAVIALLEGFFLFAYNLEWFQGRFHTDGWFAVSWGGLPVLAGYVLQTNSLSVAVTIVAVAMALFSLVEIKTSRPYKVMKRAELLSPIDDQTEMRKDLIQRFEAMLKSLSFGIMLLSVGLILWRWTSRLSVP